MKMLYGLALYFVGGVIIGSGMLLTMGDNTEMTISGAFVAALGGLLICIGIATFAIVYYSNA
jgi:hypothetical protein